MKHSNLALLSYLATCAKEGKSIPSISQLSDELGLSTSAVREQLEVARQLEVVEVKTKTGIQTSSFSVTPAICLAARYGLDLDPDMIWEILSVRQHLELAYWQEAVVHLTRKDADHLANSIESALKKINSNPSVIPMDEHKEFHLAIYRPLNNFFLNSVLEAYWEVNQSFEYSLYTDKASLENVWTYHKKIYQAIATRDYHLGYQALKTHFEIVRTKSKPELKQRFE